MSHQAVPSSAPRAVEVPPARWTTLRTVCGHIAMWVVRGAHPHGIPEDISRVVATFEEDARLSFDDHEMALMTRADIVDLLRRYLLPNPRVIAWGTKDDVALDLDALVTNVAREVEAENRRADVGR